MNVYTKYNDGYYKSKIEKPYSFECKCNRRWSIPFGGTDIKLFGTSTIQYKFCPDCGDNLIELIEKQMKIRDQYTKEENKVWKEFETDCIEHVGLTGHKFAEKIYDHAYNEKHSCMSDVPDYMLDIVDLLKDLEVL